MSFKCPQCESPSSASLPFGVRESCESCHVDFHSCQFCQFYEPSSYNECREPRAERILDKEKSNRCDEFQFNISENSNSTSKKEDLLKEAEALFKK